MTWNSTRKLTLAAVALGFLGAAGLTSAETVRNACAAPPVTVAATAKAPAGYSYGYVYLFRGLGNFPSRGIDTFKSELDALGVRNSIYNHIRWHDVADAVIATYKKDKTLAPIIIIGHSFGANAAIVMSRWLGQNDVPVRLVVTFDGVQDIPPIQNNVAEVIDYYKPPFGRATPIAPNFPGPVTATNLAGHDEITHNSIDKMEAYHKAVLARILDILKKPPKAVAKG